MKLKLSFLLLLLIFLISPSKAKKIQRRDDCYYIIEYDLEFCDDQVVTYVIYTTIIQNSEDSGVVDGRLKLLIGEYKDLLNKVAGGKVELLKVMMKPSGQKFRSLTDGKKRDLFKLLALQELIGFALENDYFKINK